VGSVSNQLPVYYWKLDSNLVCRFTAANQVVEVPINEVVTLAINSVILDGFGCVTAMGIKPYKDLGRSIHRIVCCRYHDLIVVNT
jgi:hypothetical protein